MMTKYKLIAFVVMALLILVGAGIIESISPDRRGGDYCPKCMSSDVGEYFYGYYKTRYIEGYQEGYETGYME